ncbi:copper resistance CopC/CopD family protein [Terrabacter sp. 2RAF25]|uniref:copper resistance CopC/CopD family protein n=1 Tax=Terrabacter sp. 2RAF25 TaxID=3232998 RepID=UPI003F9AA61D
MRRSRRLVRLLLAALALAFSAITLATPAWAHAELVSSTPANGTRLEVAPRSVELTFTESVDLVDGGLRLLDSTGATLATPEPVKAGHWVSWPMPSSLAKGAYVVTWRVVSSDGHPVDGAFTFGIGAAPPALPDAVGASSSAQASTAPAYVVLARLGGYLSLAAFAGVAAFLLWCGPGARHDPTLQRMARAGIVGGAVFAVASLLVQGPYAAARPLADLLDPQLVRGTLGTSFGMATLWRVALYGVLAALAWRVPAITDGARRRLVPVVTAGVAVTIAASGHGAASGAPLDLAVVAVHALTAAVWVGGLVVLVVVGRSVERRALLDFSRLAMVSVLALVATGVLNSLQHVHAIEQLFLTRYGLLLLGKLALVASALAAAAVSRRQVARSASPLLSVRAEALLTVGVLAVTAALGTTTPPPTVAAATVSGQQGVTSPVDANRQVKISLGDGRAALLAVLPATTRGSTLRVLVTTSTGAPAAVTSVALQLGNPKRGVGAIPVPLVLRDGLWEARYTFPLSGTWKATLTVKDRSLRAVVAGGDVDILP